MSCNAPPISVQLLLMLSSPLKRNAVIQSRVFFGIAAKERMKKDEREIIINSIYFVKLHELTAFLATLSLSQPVHTHSPSICTNLSKFQLKHAIVPHTVPHSFYSKCVAWSPPHFCGWSFSVFGCSAHDVCRQMYSIINYYQYIIISR